MNLPDRDALLYFQTATTYFEDAGETYTAGDLLAAKDAIKTGIRYLALGLQVVTTSKGRDTLQDSLDFWTAQLADIEAELAVDNLTPAGLVEAAENGRQLALWGD